MAARSFGLSDRTAHAISPSVERIALRSMRMPGSSGLQRSARKSFTIAYLAGALDRAER
jgi:hypothetical protein